MAKKSWFLPTILGVSLLLIFVISIFLTKGVQQSLENVDVESQRAEKAFLEKCQANFPEATAFEDDTDNMLKENDENKIIRILKANKEHQNIGMIYLVRVHGYQPGFVIMVNLDTVKKVIMNYEIVEYNETYLDKMSENFANQFNNKDYTDPVFSFDVSAGVTYSSNAIIRAVNFARASYYASIGEEVPAIKVVVESISQDYLDVTNFTCTYKKLDETKTIVLKYSNNNFEVVSGSEGLTPDEITIILTEAKNKLPQAFITDTNGNKLVISSRGYAGRMTIEIEYDATYKVTSFVVTRHGESYDESYNDLWTPSNGSPITDLPNQILNNPDNWENQNISGASVTSRGIRAAYQAALDYLAYLGGNA